MSEVPARIALVGYGEVGQTLAADLHAAGHRGLAAWDRLFVDAQSAPSRIAAARGHVRVARDLRDALSGCDLVICAVTADECLAAARAASVCIDARAFYFDLNSAAPGTKAAAGAAIDAAGGRYVEAAVMSPIGPRRIATPMLVGGPHARELAARAAALGFGRIDVHSDVVGPASAAKMCRSVLIKGMEALLAEALLAARHHGVDSVVLASLSDLLPGHDWPTLAQYMISRSLQHGRRRAAEMREVAQTVREAGIEPWMSTACAERQAWAAAHEHALEHAALAPQLDAILAARAGADGVAG